MPPRHMSHILIVALMLFAWPVAGLAHVHLDRSVPAKDAVVSAPPASIQLWFSGRVEAEFSEITVTDAAGAAIDTGTPSASDNRRMIEVPLDAIGPGDYLVKWSVVARDGHRIRGDFRFTLE